ncbi:MAG: DUF1565 domain-containing protein [Chitinivibrionales bacterium]|nr:DUF1565 domain-containing protein [Chitinivibrionales bacterium]MBD3395041.1 DUF1565 domain-containing protein [Chitinivibrionales bacterium]
MSMQHNRGVRAVCRAAAIAAFVPAAILAGATIKVPSAGIPTISQAMVKAKAGDTVYVERGVYREHVFVKSGVALVSRALYGATINGNGRGTVVTLGKSCALSGFVVTNGTIGVFSNAAGNIIEKCRIIRNWQTGIIVVRHLPRIQDNIIAFNRASGIQGWDVRSTIASVNHNTIAFNANHGIAVGGASNIIIENNTIAHNERFGLKLSEESLKSEISKNNFYKNLRTWKEVPDGNFSFDPAFIAPRSKLNFRPNPKLCCKIKGTDGKDLGARLE